MKKPRLKFHDVVPFASFLIIFLFFAISSSFRMLTVRNLNTILDQTMQTLIVASGTLFVVAQGSTDLSVGVNLALSGVIGMWAAHASGQPFLLIPVALFVGLCVGIINGIIVSRFKVPSFMLTIAMLIGVRGLVNFIQTKTNAQSLPESLAFLNTTGVKAAIFVVIMLIMAYVFEFTNVGKFSRAIGENDVASSYVGIPVQKMKIIVFAISGLMAGVSSIFSVVTVGSTSQQMGVFLEMRVIMAIFLGGVLVTGGSSAKFYKILIGAFSIQIIINGLALINKSDSHISQSVQGILLILILLMSAAVNSRTARAKRADSTLPSESKGELATAEAVRGSPERCVRPKSNNVKKR